MLSYPILEKRAGAVLYHFLCSNNNGGTWLLPANACPIVPAIFAKARTDYLLVDVDPVTHCLDLATTITLLQNQERQYAGVHFIRTLGHHGDFEPIFRAIKLSNPKLIVIDDRCLARPAFSHSGSVADLELFSGGYSKFVELDWGGWGCLRPGVNYERTVLPFSPAAHDALMGQFRRLQKEGGNFVCPNTPWLDCGTLPISPNDYFELVKSKIDLAAAHRARLNAVYEKALAEWAMPAAQRDWRFNLACECQQALLQRIFSAGHFASTHYASLVPTFGLGMASVAERFGMRVINLFNDYRYSAERAADLVKMIEPMLHEMSPIK
jgi:hypothetical protein